MLFAYVLQGVMKPLYKLQEFTLEDVVSLTSTILCASDIGNVTYACFQTVRSCTAVNSQRTKEWSCWPSSPQAWCTWHWC